MLPLGRTPRGASQPARPALPASGMGVSGGLDRGITFRRCRVKQPVCLLHDHADVMILLRCYCAGVGAAKKALFSLSP